MVDIASVLNWVGNINMVIILCSMFLYVMFNIQYYMFNRNMENHPGKQYNHKN
jgi:cell division protein FtsX